MDNNLDYSGEIVGKYNLIEKLGNGHFGSVYLAKDMVFNTTKAIKIMCVEEPEETLKLFKEAALPYKCNHDNIIKINDGVLEYFNDELVFIIDMEYVEGSNLEELIKSGKLSLIDSLNIIKAILFGLQHSHDQGILHRDIKPANIIVSDNVPKLTDFGLAIMFDDKLDEKTLWYTNHTAPECATNKTPTPQMDIYALGMTLFRMVNNIKSFSTYLYMKKNRRKWLLEGKLVQKEAFEPYVPKQVVRIVKKACNPDMSKRYKSAAEMRDAIEKLIPNINWHKVDNDFWEGNNKINLFSLSIEKKRNGSYNVLVKQNNRRISDCCKVFNKYEEALNYCYNYISSTSFL